MLDEHKDYIERLIDQDSQGFAQAQKVQFRQSEIVGSRDYLFNFGIVDTRVFDLIVVLTILRLLKLKHLVELIYI